MIDISRIDYSPLDRPEIIYRLFYPRPEWPGAAGTDKAASLLITVEEGVSVGVRLHLADQSFPTLFLFHGNGEIAADYDEMAPLFLKEGVNLVIADYRGYGRSTGNPTVTSMMRDCHPIYFGVRNYLREKGFAGPFVIMGRSLGSASALELAANYGEEIDGLVIESGFARIIPLLSLLGIYVEDLGINEEEAPSNLKGIKSFSKPTLVVHAEYDHIIPFTEGELLFYASAAKDKKLVMIPDANHNDLFFRGQDLYMEGLAWLMKVIKEGEGRR
ncbi:MAG: alpha/beta fold hydrolase [Smithellaceae bacterium]|nr:alpha/beta fold hydrolase [Smithellaceae bacterium]